MGIQALGIAFFAVSCFASLAGAQSSSSSSSVQCFPTPISAAITNVTIANGAQNAIARGVAISVGNPPQNFAFMPSMSVSPSQDLKTQFSKRRDMLILSYIHAGSTIALYMMTPTYAQFQIPRLTQKVASQYGVVPTMPSRPRHRNRGFLMRRPWINLLTQVHRYTVTHSP
jgi:hypothetical protein